MTSKMEFENICNFKNVLDSGQVRISVLFSKFQKLK